MCLNCRSDPSAFLIKDESISCQNCGFIYHVINDVPACLHPDDKDLVDFSEIKEKDCSSFIKMKQKAYFEKSFLQKLYIHYHHFAASQRSPKNNPLTLDIGFGLGEHARFITDLEISEHRFVGLELDRFKLEFIKKKFPLLPVLQGNAFRLPFVSNSFDIVQMLAFLEHFSISELSCILREVKRVLKDNGMLISCYPAEGGILLRVGQKIMHTFLRIKTGCNLEEVAHIHKSNAFEINRILEQHFKNNKSIYYPFKIKSINLNLFVNETYTNS